MVSLRDQPLISCQALLTLLLIESVVAKSRKLPSSPPLSQMPKAHTEILRPVQINYRMRITLNDGRQMTGQMLAFDKVRL